MDKSHFYCPNPQCDFHLAPFKGHYTKDGFVTRKEGVIQRFRCKGCLRRFTHRTFELDYRHRKRGIYKEIFQTSTQGLSNRAIGRNLGLSESTVRNRLKHLARQALLKWERLQGQIRIEEDISFDGFETFVFSQFDPNNINHAVGRNSLYLYDFNYAHLNRKGRMTAFQKRKKAKIEEKEGAYPRNRIEKQAHKVFHYLNGKAEKDFKLVTDEHKSYLRALGRGFFPKIKHETISSKEARSTGNPLFPINHLDLKLRHFLKSCTRETIAFNKNEMGLLDRYILHGVQKNFLFPKFLSHGKRRVVASPGMLVGAVSKVLCFWEFFDVRRTALQVRLRAEWREYYFRRIECSRFVIAPYTGN